MVAVMGEGILAVLALVEVVDSAPLVGLVILHLYPLLREIPVGLALLVFRAVIITLQTLVMVEVAAQVALVVMGVPILVEMGAQGQLVR
jgi:hypothetical protein